MDFDQKGILLVPHFTKLPSSMEMKHQPLVRNKEVYGRLKKIALVGM